MMPIDYSKNLRRILADGKTLDEALHELRVKGLSILECIIAVKNCLRCNLGEAKKIVHSSSAWADMREQHEKFHRELEDLAKAFPDDES